MNAAHFDLSLARSQLNEGSSDWLVLHLQECVSLSYQISTGQFVGMQSIGVELLSIIMDKFGKTQDPELPGHLLLEQYQAQLVSAVRSAISASSPVLLGAGLQLATKILTSGVLIGDRIAVSQMFSLISRPLNDIKDLYYPSFAEWVSCKIKVRLLAAHASIKCFVYEFFRKEGVIPDEYSQLASLLSSSSTILGKYWISILKDYAFIKFGLKSKSSFKPFLDGIQSPSVSSKVQSCLDEACALILEATSLDAIPVSLEMEKASKAMNFGDNKKSSFISGYGMVRLEHQDFDFLWGLSWLILFQGQLPANHVKMLFCCISNAHDSFLVERNEPTSSEIALLVIHSLSKERFFSLEFVTLEMCTELFQFLIYAFPSDGSWSNAIVNLLSLIMQYCTDAYFEGEDFIAAAMELYFKCLLSAFHSNKSFSLDEPSSDGYISRMWDTAMSIIRRMKRKKDQRRMITALISTTCHCFRGASSIACFSKVLLFLQNLVTLLRSYVKDIDEADSNFDDHTDSRITMLTWARMLSFLSQVCTKRIRSSDDKMNDLCIILKKILFSCLDEAVVLAKSVYQIQFFQENEEMLLSILRLCIRCIQDTISDNNNQVRAIGLTVLKRAVQQELTEVSNIKNHYFFMFFGGELLGEIYFLIQHESKESTSKESTPIIEESLTLLFLFYKLAQRIEQQQAVLMLLLEALIMVFSITSDVHSQGVHDVKAIALRLVGHLVQISTSAIQLKDAMLSLPISHRQQVQDMIRISVGSGQATAESSTARPEAEKSGDHQLHGSTVATTHTSKLEEQSIMGDNLNNEDDEDEDDWDAFQSLPANTASASTDTNSHKTEETTYEEEEELNGNHLTDAKDSKHHDSTRSTDKGGNDDDLHPCEPSSSNKAFAVMHEDYNSDETNRCTMEKPSKQMVDEQTTPLEDINKHKWRGN